MAVAKRQRKVIVRENRTKEDLRTAVSTSGKKTDDLASPVYIGQAQRGGEKNT